MAGDVPVTPEMIAAGWSIVNDGRKWPPRIGSGPGLVEVYRAMRALEPATTHQRTMDALKEMQRYLPIIEAAERDAQVWNRITAGTGIATANGYRAALAKIKEIP